MTRQPFRPNAYFDSEKATSSTFVNLTIDHSIVTHSSFFNCMFHQVNMEGSAFADVELNGSVFDRSSLRDCRFVNCDVDGLVINGVPVGELIKKHAAHPGPFIPAEHRPDLAKRLVQDRGRELARSIGAIVRLRRADVDQPKEGKDGKDSVYDGTGATLGLRDRDDNKSIEIGDDPRGDDDTGKESTDKGKDAKDVGDKEAKEKDKEKDKDDKEPDVAKLGGDEVMSPFTGDPFIRYGNPVALQVKKMEDVARAHAARFGRTFVSKPIL